MSERITSRIGAIALPLGFVVLLVAAPFHPSREDPNDNPAVFMEYAQSENWIAVHLFQFFAALLLIGGLIALYYSITAKPEAGAGVARFGLAAAVTTAAAFTMLQAVDGVALKRAVDAWASAPADREAAAFTAAEAIRWTEIGVNSLSYFLLGVTVFLYGLALALGSVYPRWVGWIAVVGGAAFMVHGVMVSYLSFFPSIPGMVASVLFGLWVFVMAFLMWRYSRQPLARPESAK